MKKSNFQLLALVMEKYDDQKQLKVHPAGPSASFSFLHRLPSVHFLVSYYKVIERNAPNAVICLYKGSKL